LSLPFENRTRTFLVHVPPQALVDANETMWQFFTGHPLS
jgi:hypothetical protein